MKRIVILFGVTLAALLVPSTARADWHSFWDRVHLDWHRNNAWPQPFSSVDRRATVMPFAIMVNKGWKMQNTLSNDLFDQETQRLTRAGELQVRRIMNDSPPQHRTVYVLRGSNDQATQVRLTTVEAAVADLTPRSQEPPAVVATGVAPRGGSADYFDRIRRGYEASTPSPRLPGATDNGQ